LIEIFWPVIFFVDILMSGWYYWFSTSPSIAALRVWSPYYGRAFFLKKRLPINFHSLIPEHLRGLASRRHRRCLPGRSCFCACKKQLPLSTLDANIVLNLAITMAMGKTEKWLRKSKTPPCLPKKTSITFKKSYLPHPSFCYTNVLYKATGTLIGKEQRKNGFARNQTNTSSPQARQSKPKDFT